MEEVVALGHRDGDDCRDEHDRGVGEFSEQGEVEVLKQEDEGVEIVGAEEEVF